MLSLICICSHLNLPTWNVHQVSMKIALVIKEPAVMKWNIAPVMSPNDKMLFDAPACCSRTSLRVNDYSLHLRSYRLFLLSPTATRRRALVLWVRIIWNEGRGGWEGKKFLFALTIILRLMTLTFSIFKFQAFSLHLLHNEVRGA